MLFVRSSQAFVLVPFCVGLFHFRFLSKEQRLLHLLISLSVLTEGVALFIDYLELFSNTPVYNVFAILQIVVYNRIFAKVLNWRILKPALNGPLFALLLFAFINLLFYQPITILSSNLIVLAMVVHIFFSVSYFRQILKSAQENYWKTDPMLWLSVGILLYNSGTIFLFIALNRITENFQATILSPWGLNALLFFLLNAFYTIALWRKQTR